VKYTDVQPWPNTGRINREKEAIKKQILNAGIVEKRATSRISAPNLQNQSLETRKRMTERGSH